MTERERDRYKKRLLSELRRLGIELNDTNSREQQVGRYNLIALASSFMLFSGSLNDYHY